MICYSPWLYLVFSIFELLDLINVLMNHDATDILFYLDFGPVMYPIKGAQFRLTFISAPFAVCPFSPTQVLSELIQPPGPHCSSPSWVTPASGTICRLLVDRQKGGSLQFLITCSGKDSL